jgi:hypothetical protein
MKISARKLFEQIQHGKSCLNPTKRDEPKDLKRFSGGSFFSRKAKIISGNFQQP